MQETVRIPIPQTQRRRIVVIEDERDIADLPAIHLRDNGFEVTLAGDGHGGLRQAFARSWDLVLLHFARHPGRVFSRAQLLDSVWGYGHDGYEHTVTSAVNQGTRFEFELPATEAA